MKPEKSTDYHDYVFKDGKFIGEFDQMYRFSKEIPWHQDTGAYSQNSDWDIAILKPYQYDSICDVGCGLGYFSHRLYSELSSHNHGRPHVTGVDISLTAIREASRLFPNIKFINADMTRKNKLLRHQFDLVVTKEIFWYILYKLDTFLKNIIDSMKQNGFLYVALSFPPDEKWVGKDIFDSPQKLNEILSKYTEPISFLIKENHLRANNPIALYLGKKSAKGF